MYDPLKREYPLNLYDDVWNGRYGKDLPEDCIPTAAYVLATLPARDAAIMAACYKDGMTHEKIAERIGVTRQRISQVIIRSLERLRQGAIPKLLEYGVRGWYSEIEREESRKRLESAVAAVEDIASMLRSVNGMETLIAALGERRAPESEPDLDPRLSVRRLELSARTVNALETAGANTIGEVCLLTDRELMSVANIGAKSYDELKAALHAHGFRNKGN